jgi:phosphatidylglycerol:prolipoprotein diacylglycerol transferase
MRLDSYSSFLEVISIWNGGLAIYGGIIGGSIALFIVCRVKKLNALKLFDCVSPGVMLAQAIGRWGNFFNGEAFGATPDESHPLYFLRMGLRHEGWSQEYIYQPDFLYESLWNLLGFILINIFYRRKKYDGQIFIMYLTWYGFGRMLIEGSRTDSLYLGVFRVSQVLGFLCFVIGTVLLIVLGARARRLRLAEGSYDSVYGRVLGERERGGRPAAAADAAAEAAEAGAEEAGPETEAAGAESAEAGDETAAGQDEKAGAEADSGTDAYAGKPDGQSGGEA